MASPGRMFQGKDRFGSRLFGIQDKGEFIFRNDF